MNYQDGHVDRDKDRRRRTYEAPHQPTLVGIHNVARTRAIAPGRKLGAANTGRTFQRSILDSTPAGRLPTRSRFVVGPVVQCLVFERRRKICFGRYSSFC
jgi:hypothetical protein